MGSRSPFLTFLQLFILLFAAGCGHPQTPQVIQSQPQPVADQGQVYPLDPLFTDFYKHFESIHSLGPAISPRVESNGVVQQYLESGLLVYDPALPGSERVHLAPLGRDFGVDELPAEGTPDTDSLVIDGHQISGDFLALYNQLGGAQFVGLPLTDAHYNLENRRLEQYFENLGFYQLKDGSGNDVRLMAYGLYACDRRCRYQAPLFSIPVWNAALDKPFAQEAARLGLEITGQQLSRPQPGWDGREEVIFENLVLVADLKDPLKINLRPAVALLEPPASELETASSGSLWSFYSIQGELGFNIPLFFEDFLNRFGGLDFSGPPFSRVMYLPDGYYKQCFTNLCLEYDPAATVSNRLRLAPVGKAYQEHFGANPGVSFYASQSLDHITMRVWEGKASVASGQVQDIHVAILDGTTPLANREPVLYLVLPDGSQKTYRFPPTDGDGVAVLNVPVYAAPNGTLVLYSVCLYGAGGGERCTKDNYLIWNNPN